eukprot:751369-Hanusia_phi.AAC.2
MSRMNDVYEEFTLHMPTTHKQEMSRRRSLAYLEDNSDLSPSLVLDLNHVNQSSLEVAVRVSCQQGKSMFAEHQDEIKRS